jgi:predicted Fe-Mo cluster-binding NifX family protein
MIAIPIDSMSLDAKSSRLFGNVNYFAIYEPEEKTFEFLKNSESGNGIKTAKFLHNSNVTTTVYSYMGDGPFKSLNKNSVDVYYIGKEPMKLHDIIQKIEDGSFTKVETHNASTYLDPGTSSENCECTCKA